MRRGLVNCEEGSRECNVVHARRLTTVPTSRPCNAVPPPPAPGTPLERKQRGKLTLTLT